eukprot:gene1632-1001_t
MNDDCDVIFYFFPCVLGVDVYFFLCELLIAFPILLLLLLPSFLLFRYRWSSLRFLSVVPLTYFLSPPPGIRPALLFWRLDAVHTLRCGEITIDIRSTNYHSSGGKKDKKRKEESAMYVLCTACYCTINLSSLFFFFFSFYCGESSFAFSSHILSITKWVILGDTWQKQKQTTQERCKTRCKKEKVQKKKATALCLRLEGIRRASFVYFASLLYPQRFLVCADGKVDVRLLHGSPELLYADAPETACVMPLAWVRLDDLPEQFASRNSHSLDNELSPLSSSVLQRLRRPPGAAVCSPMAMNGVGRA